MRLVFIKNEPFPITEISGLENKKQEIQFLQQYSISGNKLIWICLCNILKTEG
jgi:hypothetical protein